ncbi:MAG: hypothetical protein ACE15B_06895 [Bryobacteraceae bacterium]
MNLDHTSPYFNLTTAACRAAGARGGRARARNLRLRRTDMRTPVPATFEPREETIHEANILLDAQFPWLRGAEARQSRGCRA